MKSFSLLFLLIWFLTGCNTTSSTHLGGEELPVITMIDRPELKVKGLNVKPYIIAALRVYLSKPNLESVVVHYDNVFWIGNRHGDVWRFKRGALIDGADLVMIKDSEPFAPGENKYTRIVSIIRSTPFAEYRFYLNHALARWNVESIRLGAVE